MAARDLSSLQHPTRSELKLPQADRWTWHPWVDPARCHDVYRAELAYSTCAGIAEWDGAR